jgi:hypothetical protein
VTDSRGLAGICDLPPEPVITLFRQPGQNSNLESLQNRRHFDMKKEVFMRKLFCMTVLVVLCLSTSSALAGGFKAYPGAALDRRATDDANQMAKQANITGNTQVFTTADAFGKVVSYYKSKGIGKEYVMPGGSNKRIKQAYFIFDGGKDLMASKIWAKIQRPVMGLYKEDLQNMKVRDITAIIFVHK